MARTTSSSLNLDLGCEGMGKLQKLVQGIWALYQSEFPDEPTQAPVLPSTDIDMSACAGVYTPAHVKASRRIETQQCRHVQELINEHVHWRVAFIVVDLDAIKVNARSERVLFMKEPCRELFMCDSSTQVPLQLGKYAEIDALFLDRSQRRHYLDTARDKGG